MNRLEFSSLRTLSALLLAAAFPACTEGSEVGGYDPGLGAHDSSVPGTLAGGGQIGGNGTPGGGSTSGGSPGGSAGGSSDASVDAGGGGGTGNGLPCAIKKIVAAKCGACHSDPPVGTYMPLVTAAHFKAMGTSDKTKTYGELAKTRIAATSNPMPPVTSEPLTADEKTALTNWINQGSPGSNESCNDGASDGGAPEAAVDAGVEDLNCYKFLAHAEGDKNKKFKVGVKTDAYFSFGFQAPWQGNAYAQVFRPVIDNSKVLHHWLLYKEPTLDGIVKTTIGQHELGELLAGWAPGGITMDFRASGVDVAMELPAETYSLELHYNSSDPNAEDASGVEVCAKKGPTKEIATMSWVGYDQGGILSYASGICLEPSTSWVGTCKPTRQEPIHILFMVPHMHVAGRHMKSVINGPNGSRMLHDKPFDFNYQTTYATNEVLMPGESITTTCTYSENKCAGQATTQEMCYNFMYAYPKYALTDNGLEGTYIHGAGACLGQ